MKQNYKIFMSYANRATKQFEVGGIKKIDTKRLRIWRFRNLFVISNPELTLKYFKTMAYKIIDIEGVGEVYAEKLIAAGINTPEQLLAKCAAPKGRKELAEQTGITEKLILKWTNHADLFRIHGVGPQFAELLEAAGVDTVKELSHRVPANLAAKMEEVNAEKKLVGRVPAVKEVEKMVDEAKTMPAVMTY